MKYTLDKFRHLFTDSTVLESIELPNVIQVRGSLTLTDQSVLHIRENSVRTTGWIDYSYHWQTADHEIIHRWDNAHSVPFETSPFHQHVGSEENIQPSEPMTLETVLQFIATHISAG